MIWEMATTGGPDALPLQHGSSYSMQADHVAPTGMLCSNQLAPHSKGAGMGRHIQRQLPDHRASQLWWPR